MVSNPAKPVRLGVLGAANIARQFVAAIAPSERVSVADIDAVYLPLPNTLHAEWAIRALDAGKHVLCEKPLATSLADARAMFDAAGRNGRYLVEGYPYLAQAHFQKLRAMLGEGAIGQIRVISSNFGVRFDDPANIRLRPDVGGGALPDAGSYAFSLVRIVAGERPSRVMALADWGETGVDRSLVATPEFPGGLLATLTCGFATAYHRFALIAGERGTIETTFLNHPALGGPARLVARLGTDISVPRENIDLPGGNGFLAEADAFARMIVEGPAFWTGATPAESIDIALTLEALALSAREGRPATLQS